MKAIAKVTALLPLAALLFLGNAYGSLWFAGYLFPRVDPRPYSEMISSAAVGAVVGGILVGYAIARLFPLRWWIAALAVSAPLMALRISDFCAYVGTSQTSIIIMSLVEAILVPTGAVTATWLFTRRYPRPQSNAA